MSMKELLRRLWRYGCGDSVRTIASMFAVGEHVSGMRSKLLVPNLPAYPWLKQYLSTSHGVESFYRTYLVVDNF